MKRVAALLAIVFAPGLFSIAAQAKELTLDDCIEVALKNRAAIIRARGAEGSPVLFPASGKRTLSIASKSTT